MTLDPGSLLITIVSAVAGVLGAVVAVITYYWAQILRRKESLFPLIDKFNSSNDMMIAKKILDGFVIDKEDLLVDKDKDLKHGINEYSFNWEIICTTRDKDNNELNNLKNFLKREFALDWVESAAFRKIDNNSGIEITVKGQSMLIKLDKKKNEGTIVVDNNNAISGLISEETIRGLEVSMARYYWDRNLHIILRDHRTRSVLDYGEVIIRDSFDALLGFFIQLEYLYHTLNVIHSEEIEYFRYYIDKAAGNEHVLKYLAIYEFPLKGVLDGRLQTWKGYVIPTVSSATLVLDRAKVMNKGVRTKDNQDAGVVVAVDNNNITVSSGGRRYMLPKSNVEGFTGSEILLKLLYSELWSFKTR